ncbi:MAG: peptidase prolyl oligopeptidase active site domain protein [Actinomycetia bacterium]|nr:peptidase prolyl oligopeptidase active site domain protein [Actinomycetes bacterium]
MLGLRPDDVELLVSAADPRLSPDGTRVAFSVDRPDLEHNRYQTRTWVAPADGSTAAAPQTPEDVNASVARWSPDGALLAYCARPVDDDDAETELRVMPAGGGDHRVVTTSREPIRELEWSPDGSRLAFVARDPDPERYGPPGEQRKEKDMPPRRIERLFTRLDSVGWTSDRPARVFVVAAAGANEGPVAITAGPFDASGVTWSPDGARVAFASARHDTADLDWAVDLFVADSTTGALQQLTETGSDYMLPSFAPDGTRLACVLAPTPLEGPWHGRIAIVAGAGGEPTVLTAELDRNCAPYPAVRAPVWDGDALLFLIEDRGFVHLWRVDAGGAGKLEPVLAGARTIAGFDVAGETLAFVALSATSLPEVYVRAHGEELRLTDFTSALAEHDRQVAAPERFTATAPDGSEIDCWIMEPDHAPGTRAPVLLNIHGGPFTQYGERVFDEFQFEVGAGFGVLFCNPRGSSGYDEAWGRAIRWPECAIDAGSGWGGVDYDDVMACVDEALRRYDWIDADRLGVMGGSYGGYMTSWIIGHTDRFAAAVSERSCNNLLTLEHGSDVAGAFVSYVGVRHIDDPAAYLRQSPISYVREMRTPLLIVHSENDLRCPVNQAEELFVALRLLDRTPEFVRFPGESHELSRGGAPKHRVQRAELILDFMDRHLIPRSAAAPNPTG